MSQLKKEILGNPSPIRRKWNFDQNDQKTEVRSVVQNIIAGRLVLSNIATNYIYETKDGTNNLRIGDRVVCICWAQCGKDVLFGASIFRKSKPDDNYRRKCNRETALIRLLRWPNRIPNTTTNPKRLDREVWKIMTTEERKEWSRLNIVWQSTLLKRVREEIFNQGVSSRKKAIAIANEDEHVGVT